MRLDGNNFNLRHLNCGVVDIWERRQLMMGFRVFEYQIGGRLGRQFVWAIIEGTKGYRA